MTIRLMLLGQVLALVVLTALSLVAALAVTDQDRDESAYIELAERQRLLGQTLLAEASMYGGGPQGPARDQVETTATDLAVTLSALRRGPPALLDSRLSALVPEEEDRRLRGELEALDLHWAELEPEITALLTAADRRVDALASVVDGNRRLLELIDGLIIDLLFEEGSSAAVIVAARQVILNQLMTLQALLQDSDVGSELRDKFALFERSLSVLQLGGVAPIRLNGTGRLTVKGPPASSVLAQLQEVEELWILQKAALLELAQQERALNAARSGLSASGAGLVRGADRVVRLVRQAAHSRMGGLREVQLGAAVAALLSALIGGLFVLSVSRSLRRLSTVADGVSRGALTTRVEAQGFGEVRRLSRSFERMRFSLHATMDMLEQEQVPALTLPETSRGLEDAIDAQL